MPYPKTQLDKFPSGGSELHHCFQGSPELGGSTAKIGVSVLSDDRLDGVWCVPLNIFTYSSVKIRSLRYRLISNILKLL